MSEQQATYLDRPTAHWVQSLADPDPLKRRLGVYALGEIGSAAQSAARKLEEALMDPAPMVGVWAAAALARVLPEEEKAIRWLRKAMRHELYWVRSLGAWHLGRLGPDHPGVLQVLPDLENLLNDFDRSVRCEAQIALQRLQGKGRPPEELKTVASQVHELPEEEPENEEE